MKLPSFLMAGKYSGKWISPHLYCDPRRQLAILCRTLIRQCVALFLAVWSQKDWC